MTKQRHGMVKMRTSLRGPVVATAIVCLGVAAIAVPAAKAQANPVRQAITSLYEQQSHVRSVSGVVLNADGTRLAWSEDEGEGKRRRIYAAAANASAPPVRLTDVPETAECHEDSPEFSPDAHRIAFLSDCATPGQTQLVITAADATASTKAATPVTHFAGYVSHPQWSPDGSKVAVLYVASASRVPSPLAAETRAVGVIDEEENKDVERVAVVDPRTGETRVVTPPGLYIFEYDWSPDSRRLAYTAAAPPGDDNWYIAKLYTQSLAASGDQAPVAVYAPRLQIALPRWSPDGHSLAFVQGLMSDEGATGGEIFVVPATGGEPRNLTPGRTSSPSWFHWLEPDKMLMTEFVGGSTAINTLDVRSGKTAELWRSGGETLQAGPAATSLAVAAHAAPGALPVTALSRQGWSMLPEVWAGPVGSWTEITHLNASVALPLPKAESVSWADASPTAAVKSEVHAQGWLLFPTDYDPAKKYPLLVAVHGGPAWIAQPTWRASDFDTTLFCNLGYFVFFPNDRGSYGEGEAFTQANRRDWGHGDLDDLLAGVDAVVKKYPVDADRAGILGWSYGGSTAMMAVTRSHRFRAAVAGAGAGNMQSYYGQNSIDKWMIPYFGTSVYDDPAAYMYVSAIQYVKGAQTPTLVVVGERDGEAPPAQSFEFWHALKELGVTTQLVVYPDEGHSFFRQQDRIDVTYRAYAWFKQYMGAK